MRPLLGCGLLALAFAATAALFDAEPLWVPAVALAALAGGSAAWVLWAARGVSVRRVLGARRVIEGEPLSIVIEVAVGRVRMPAATIVDPLCGELALPAGRALRRVRLDARFDRRGRRVLAAPRLRIADPLGLATREILAAPAARDDDVLVLPRIEPVVAFGAGGGALRRARHGGAAIGAEVELDGIRPLRTGTSAARIYWPSIARGGPAHERVLSAERDGLPLIVLDPRDAASDEQLDAAVRATASLAHALAAAGGCALLLPGDRRATELAGTRAGWPQVHARLALLGSDGGPSPAAVAGRRGPVIFVSARLRARLPRALCSAAGATRVLVVPGTLAPRHAAFAVAGCHGYLERGARLTANAAARSAAAGAGR